ncbi:MAG: methionyl-tRNA formyltransferase [Sulfurihydrogenibium sp.]|uniref:methionyl-tRNA formyltransferase n=1 Tax=Sulfurihydrogenibium sp. TaxID=2053621 RepID=UPI003C79FCE5
MKVLFWGTPDFAVESLKALLSSKHQVVGVITQPDKPKGRGQKVQPTPVKEEALKHGLLVYQPEKIKNNPEVVDFIKNLNPDISVVVAYGKILPEEVINIPKYKTINVHASLLPKYRGAAPIHRAIMDGEEETGVCIMEIVKELDAGDIYRCKKVKIEPNDDIITLHDKLAKEGAKLLIEVLDDIEEGKVEKTPQDSTKATYAKPIEKEEAKINWEKPAKDIYNQIRALKVWPKAYSNFRNQQVKILDAEVVECPKAVKPGEVVKSNDKEGIIVATKEGCILIKTLQFPNSKPISSQEAVRGYKIKEGEVFE